MKRKFIRYPKLGLRTIPTLDTISIELVVDMRNVTSAKLIDEDKLSVSEVVGEWEALLVTIESLIIQSPQLISFGYQDGKPLSLNPELPGSRYFYVGVKNASGELQGKIVIDLRVSTHDPTRQGIQNRAKHQVAKLKQLQDNKQVSQDAQVVTQGIVVNQKEFSDYEHARRAIVGKLHKIVERYQDYDSQELE